MKGDASIINIGMWEKLKVQQHVPERSEMKEQGLFVIRNNCGEKNRLFQVIILKEFIFSGNQTLL